MEKEKEIIELKNKIDGLNVIKDKLENDVVYYLKRNEVGINKIKIEYEIEIDKLK